ncbi:hypothetical protein VHP8226_03190 [Vibrio hippocampi]|uniref:Uncharacterized protein n=1 Tax=Vibrio hippocampi TaxID=654686 RepID=A0ABM8ZLP2_9VIBR|nr:hypothetical protein VHP8226_03190 [Vibrio hippocampi]
MEQYHLCLDVIWKKVLPLKKQKTSTVGRLVSRLFGLNFIVMLALYLCRSTFDLSLSSIGFGNDEVEHVSFFSWVNSF